jgi:hypothetical protein
VNIVLTVNAVVGSSTVLFTFDGLFPCSTYLVPLRVSVVNV